ncbi:MAG TPA: cupin domain-containing protein, partial [Thermomicrobiales bacterium]|nr:cupin domain-containing protein [Thermomicrobiales bacterium]
MIEGQKIYGRADISEVIASIPPDPNSEARHRANTLIKTSTLRVVVVTMLEDGELQEHTAPGPITIHTIEGSMEVDVEGEAHPLDAGELISLAPGVRHAVRCTRDGAFLLTIGVFLREPDPGGRHGG